MELIEPQTTSYDKISFTSKPSPERHPNRLSVIAHLSGLGPKPVSVSRVLELGCSTGDNLLPIASAFPGAVFVGVDSSAEQIRQAQESASALGISNITFQCLDFLNWDLSVHQNQPVWENFDYIFCHGIYSWVAETVRRQILEIAFCSLADSGVFFLSYNALPQNVWRETVRRAVKMLGSGAPVTPKSIPGVREILKYLDYNLLDDPRPYASELRLEVEQLAKQSDAFLFHEILEEHGDGFYFADVASAARAKGFRYLGDARPSRTRYELDLDFVKSQGDFGSRTDMQRIECAEQIRDLISPVSLRESLFVKESVTSVYHGFRSDGDFSSERIKTLFIATSLVPLSEEPVCCDFSPEEFSDPRGYYLTFRSPAAKTAIREMSLLWPETISYSELIERVNRCLKKEGASKREISFEVEELPVLLLDLFKKNLADFFFERPEIQRLDENPRVYPVVYRQASRLGWATNLRHEYQVFDPFTIKLLSFLDGRHTRSELSSLMRKEAGPAGEAWEECDLEASIEQSLVQLEESAFLVAPAS